MIDPEYLEKIKKENADKIVSLYGHPVSKEETLAIQALVGKVAVWFNEIDEAFNMLHEVAVLAEEMQEKVSGLSCAEEYLPLRQKAGRVLGICCYASNKQEQPKINW